MQINEKYILSKLSELFDAELSKIEPEQDGATTPAIELKEAIQIIKFNKNNTNMSNIMKQCHINNDMKTIMDKALFEEKGSVIAIILENNVVKKIDGRWDDVITTPNFTQHGIRITIIKNNLYGLMSDSGEVKINPFYSSFKLKENKLDLLGGDKWIWAKSKKQNDSEYGYGAVSCEGRVLTPFDFHISENNSFKLGHKEYIKVRTESGIGVYDVANKKFFINCGDFKSIIENKNNKSNSIIVKNNLNKYAIINENTSIPTWYDHLQFLSETYVIALKDKKIGIISSSDGKVIIPIIHEKIASFNPNKAIIALTLNENKKTINTFYNLRNGIKIKEN